MDKIAQTWQPIPLNEMIIREVPKSGPGGKDVGVVDESSFQVVHIDKVITLRAGSASDKRQWMNVVEGAIAQAEKRLTKEMSMDMIQDSVDKPMIGTLEVNLLEAKKLAGSDKIRKFLICAI